MVQYVPCFRADLFNQETVSAWRQTSTSPYTAIRLGADLSAGCLPEPELLWTFTRDQFRNIWRKLGTYFQYFIAVYGEVIIIYIPHSSAWMYPALCPQGVFACSIWFTQWTATVSLNNINRLFVVMETECVPCEVRTGYSSDFDFGLTFQTRVEAGSNTSTVTLGVVRGDEKGSLKTETVKYGDESQGTRTRDRLPGEGQQHIQKTDPSSRQRGPPTKTRP
jgi:hypothetical protein